MSELRLPIQEVHITSNEDELEGFSLPRSVTCMLTDADARLFSLHIQTQEYVEETSIAQAPEGPPDERPEPILMVSEAGIDKALIHRLLGGMSADLLGLYVVPQTDLA